MKPDPNPSRDTVSESELHALVDGRLDPGSRAALLARVAGDATAQVTLRAWQQQRDALAGLHRDLLVAEVPPELLSAARLATNNHQQADRWWRWGGMAASVLCAFGLGWLSHGQLMPPDGTQSSLAADAPQRANVREFVHQASVAHMVYAPEQRHPVEVTAAQQDHLVQWLSKRLDRPLKIPDLRAQGYELVGGRLLPGVNGARAQFMYQDQKGERVTLYLGAMNAQSKAPANPAPGNPVKPGPLPATADRAETAFSFSNEGPVPGFYWVDKGFGYALAGQLSREQLMQLAQAVYGQL